MERSEIKHSFAYFDGLNRFDSHFSFHQFCIQTIQTKELNNARNGQFLIICTFKEQREKGIDKQNIR